MTDLDLLHFEQLKREVQHKYLENHIPSDEDIAQWKGIDITYFQEDLMKHAKGSMSEKSFYTYFKTSPVLKLPRIDLLNLLSSYTGYASWYEFKKEHNFAEELLQAENKIQESAATPFVPEVISNKIPPEIIPAPQPSEPAFVNSEDQKAVVLNTQIRKKKVLYKRVRKYAWFGTSILLAVIVLLLVFQDSLFSKKYQFHFVDADRGSAVQNVVEIKILKKGESPLNYRVAPGQDFVYTTKDKVLKMAINSTFYQPDTIVRILQNSPEKEVIELKPNEYNMMLYSYSTSKNFKSRKAQLENLISNNALIYQVFDNKYFNVETMTKERYIAFLSLPTTSLENLDVIETQIKNGKIVLIKFRIKTPENETNK